MYQQTQIAFWFYCYKLRDPNFLQGSDFLNQMKLRTLKSRRGGAGIHCNGLYEEAPPETGTFFRHHVYERVGILLVEVYERVG